MNRVHFLVDRYHVGEKTEIVVKEVLDRLSDDTPGDTMVAVAKQVVKQHEANRKLYVDVMSGRVG